MQGLADVHETIDDLAFAGMALAHVDGGDEKAQITLFELGNGGGFGGCHVFGFMR